MAEVFEADVLVIGGGIAGLMAAVAAKSVDPSLEVVLLDKCEAGKSGSSVQAKGLAAVGNWSFPDDSTKAHLEDTIKSGCGINNVKLARLVVEKIGEVLDEVEHMGMLFDRKEAWLYASPGDTTAGHRHYRDIHLRDSTGKALLDVLRREAYRRGVLIKNGVFVTELLVQDGRAFGAIGFLIKTGEIVAFTAGAIVIATGGAGYLYARTSNPPQVTGDGIWLAYEAGAELMDMEMVQFYPVNYVYPKALEGKNVGSYAQARLYNANGERFMKYYDSEHMENTTRDKLAQAIYMEIRKGNGTEHGGVYIDRTGLGEEYYAQFPVEVQTCLEGGLDIRTQRGEVAPAAHYLMGGIRIDENCESSVSHLFAAGEAAAGVHGANRLANNSLSDTLVLGHTAGMAAARSCRSRTSKISRADITKRLRVVRERLEALLATHGKRAPIEVKDALRQKMWEDVGVVRSRTSLEKAIQYFEQEKQGFFSSIKITSHPLKANFEIVEALEALYMLGVAQLIARAALYREESRGAHYREDYPQQDDNNWLKNVVIKRNGEGIEISAVSPVTDRWEC